mmetsp:Transcript_1379/g.3990  ORF Transcript_1379/g.3990 Transcript_1379/m.3990 type:complete len:452 (+) Transcript_1379:3399-4754(+)
MYTHLHLAGQGDALAVREVEPVDLLRVLGCLGPIVAEADFLTLLPRDDHGDLQGPRIGLLDALPVTADDLFAGVAAHADVLGNLGQLGRTRVTRQVRVSARLASPARVARGTDDGEIVGLLPILLALELLHFRVAHVEVAAEEGGELHVDPLRGGPVHRVEDHVVAGCLGGHWLSAAGDEVVHFADDPHLGPTGGRLAVVHDIGPGLEGLSHVAQGVELVVLGLRRGARSGNGLRRRVGLHVHLLVTLLGVCYEPRAVAKVQGPSAALHLSGARLDLRAVPVENDRALLVGALVDDFAEFLEEAVLVLGHGELGGQKEHARHAFVAGVVELADGSGRLASGLAHPGPEHRGLDVQAAAVVDDEQPRASSGHRSLARTEGRARLLAPNVGVVIAHREGIARGLPRCEGQPELHLCPEGEVAAGVRRVGGPVNERMQSWAGRGARHAAATFVL